LYLNQFLRESRYKIIRKLYEEETIFIFAFNAENFMKIRKGMTSRECFENKWFTTKKSYFFQLRREARKFLGYFV
jgi:hypothetical protein